ncbi:MAG: arylesterase [Kiritimatiellae bacterium]|nr:arylesterase [Kiritimatiellia bacterium]MDW8457871.1 arylesterase [Verrucomicrobiota bacterium]
MIARVVALAALLGAVAAAEPIRVLCLGDSLTAGYGLSPNEAWPALAETMLRAQGFDIELVNAGLSGDTTAGGIRRMEWLMKERYDILVLALGANDALRGLAVGELERNLQRIIELARHANPEIRILLAGMRAPPNMGPEYAAAFDAVFPRVAERNGVRLWPFMLEGVGGVPELNLEDGIHPNAEGQRRIAEMAAGHLRAMLEAPGP